MLPGGRRRQGLLTRATERLRRYSGDRFARRGERGVSALEMAFIAPSLIFLIFFTIQGALYFYGRNVAIQAAREGVSQLRLSQTRADYENRRDLVVGNIERYVAQVGREALLDPRATPTYDEEAGRVDMTVTGRVITLVPGLELEATGTAHGSVERFAGDLPR